LRTAADPRWQLYRLLGDPLRLRLLALVAHEELAVGEMAELLNESQPNVSRQLAPLRQAGLLGVRRQGTRTLVKLVHGVAADAVVADALAAGRLLCREDGSLQRIGDVVRARDARGRELFAEPPRADELPSLPPELLAYLRALGALLERRAVAIDAGTGDGALLDVLAPVFARVIGFDRSQAQLERARRRVRSRGFDNVELLRGDLESAEVRRAAGEGADAVFASRMLHHAPVPRATLAALGALVRPGGRLIVLDYQRHEDEALREEQADVWLGFEPEELAEHARAVGLLPIGSEPLPAGFVKNAIDGHLGWLLFVASRAPSPAAQRAAPAGKRSRATKPAPQHKEQR
jgi:ArsR family transcriptional regulator